MYKIIGANNAEYGPVGADTIRQWIAEGRINAQTQIQAQGETGWKPISSYPEFAGSFGPLPSAPLFVPPPAPGASSSSPQPFVSGTASPYMRQAALGRINGPSIALIIVASFSIAYFLFSLVINLTVGSDSQMEAFLKMQPNQSPAFVAGYKSAFKIAQLAWPVASMVFSAIIIFGAIQMRRLSSHGLCMTAAVLAIIPCVSPCCVLGIPFGIWALVVLCSAEVKSQFN